MLRSLLSRRTVFIAVILLPIILMIGIFIYYPALDTFQTSLTNRNLRINRPPQFILLNNYGALLTDPLFWEVTERSLILVVLTLPLEMILAFLVSLLLNENFRGRSVVRTIALV